MTNQLLRTILSVLRVLVQLVRKEELRLITIDYSDRRPIYEQIVERIKDLILYGVITADSQLPSVRSLAVDLSINPNTIQRAYAELERQGVIYCVKGRGNFVAATKNLMEQHKEEIRIKMKELAIEAKKANLTLEEFIDYLKGAWEEL